MAPVVGYVAAVADSGQLWLSASEQSPGASVQACTRMAGRKAKYMYPDGYELPYSVPGSDCMMAYGIRRYIHTYT